MGSDARVRRRSRASEHRPALSRDAIAINLIDATFCEPFQVEVKLSKIVA